MRKLIQHLLMGTLCLLAASVFAQNSEPGTPTQGMSATDFKSGVTSGAQKISDALMQDLQQQLATYRIQHPVGAAPYTSAPLPSNLAPPPANTTPPTSPPTGITTYPPAPSSTYTGFGTSQPASQNPLYRPAPSAPVTKPSSQWNIKY